MQVFCDHSNSDNDMLAITLVTVEEEVLRSIVSGICN